MNLVERTAQLTVGMLAGSATAPMTIDAIVAAIMSLYSTLEQLAEKETVIEGWQSTKLSTRDHFASSSIGEHVVTCLECGHNFELLSGNHLTRHGLTSRAYKERHGIPMWRPLSSRALTERRKERYRKKLQGSVAH